MENHKKANVSPYAKITPLQYGSVEMADPFWDARRETIRRTAILRQWFHLERTGCVDNFRIAAGVKTGEFRGWGFADSDLYKWLEAAVIIAAKNPGDTELAGHVEEMIDLIRRTQSPDGYINTYFQLAAPGHRYKNLLAKHELYCMGHLIEAACTHFRVSSRRDLLEVAEKCGDHICATFGKGLREEVPGHEEIELAMIQLYRTTGHGRYLDTARFFIEERGRTDIFRRMVRNAVDDMISSLPVADPPKVPFMPKEKQNAGSAMSHRDVPLPVIIRGMFKLPTREYFQMHSQVRDHKVAEGHSVRAMYLYTGVSDLYLETGGSALFRTLEDVWSNTITKRTYITGGMGTFPYSEGFGADYELHNTSYTETCAAIGSFFFSWRMLQATGAPQYASQMERALYNAILGCMAQDGTRYFYSNPLVSFGHAERREWYDVPCCPPNIARLFWSLEQYIYGVTENTLWVHHYIGSRACLALGGVEAAFTMKSGFPFDGNSSIVVSLPQSATFSLKLRVPDWAKEAEVAVNGAVVSRNAASSCYLAIDREWNDGDEVTISFAMTARASYDRKEVVTNRGYVAITRGPIVYCVQGSDNSAINVHGMKADPANALTTEPDGDTVVIIGRTTDGKPFRAVPYFTWGNKGKTDMAVWIKSR